MARRQVIAAGIGCRRNCPPAPIVALIRQAAAKAGIAIDALAAPASKSHEPGLHQAAAELALPLHLVPDARIAAMQPLCPTRSTAAHRATGHASIAEAAALAHAGLPLILPRIHNAHATCALAGVPDGA